MTTEMDSAFASLYKVLLDCIFDEIYPKCLLSTGLVFIVMLTYCLLNIAWKMPWQSKREVANPHIYDCLYFRIVSPSLLGNEMNMPLLHYLHRQKRGWETECNEENGQLATQSAAAKEGC